MTALGRTIFIVLMGACTSCISSIEQSFSEPPKSSHSDPELVYPLYHPAVTDLIVSRHEYKEKLHGFWLAQSIANWTGLITEMDKVGTEGNMPFYTDENWGKADEKNIWGNYSNGNKTIDFVFVEEGEVWGADDDTDIEYMYQHLIDINNNALLTPEQIRLGWMNHIYTNEQAPDGENFLWVSNERALILMHQGVLPPATSDPDNNPDYEMIDAQLTTEIFGLFAPARPDLALQFAHLPIRTSAKNNAEWISEFYVSMYSLASKVDTTLSKKQQVFWLAEKARVRLPEGSFSAAMYEFVKQDYDANPDITDWESTRDKIYQRYQLSRNDGYHYQNSFDAGINFAASLVSLFYGGGDLVNTIKIGSLAGWDSDNPTATWAGLLGFMLGRSGVEAAFSKTNFSERYWIHRTRRNFPDYTPGNDGEDTFSKMATRAIAIIDRVVLEDMGGGVDLEADCWYIPQH